MGSVRNWSSESGCSCFGLLARRSTYWVVPVPARPLLLVQHNVDASLDAPANLSG